ncbi:MAG: DMT family transporter [Proteobacteria bacterium]|nr:DMT family transporter [Pseudomonadota bacterium]
MKHPLFKDYLLLLLVAAIWGTSFSMIKIGVTEIGPATLTAGRILIAALALVIWLRFIRRVRLDLSAPAMFSYAVIGLFGNALPFTLIGWSEQTLDSSLTAVLMGIMPLFTVIMAHYFLEDEPFSSRSLTGIGLGFSGLLVLLGASAWNGTDNELLAQITVLVASLSYAGVTIFVRRQVTASGIEVATGALIAGTIFAFIFAFTLENPMQMNWNLRAVVPMTLLGLFPTALASVLYFRLVHNLGATRFAQINYIIPVFGSIIGVYLMGEQTEWRMWMALALVLSGIFMVHGAHRGAPRVL